jgi:uncharacterized protein with HEPN domain
MTRHDDVTSLRHMLEFARKSVKFTDGKSRIDLARDETLALATTYVIEYLGEASRRISEEFRERHPEIPWGEIIGTRNRLAHAYEDISLDIIWAIVKKDIPTLIIKLEKILDEEN